MKGRFLRPRNFVLATAIAAPCAYRLAFATEEDGSPRIAKPWQVAAYRLIPLNAASRAWGALNDVELPVWLRPAAFGLYARVFGVNLDEMQDKDLSHYRCLGDFFYRELKADARPIANSLLTSPCDGKILGLGKLNGQRIDVKGGGYTMEELLGPLGAPGVPAVSARTNGEVEVVPAKTKLSEQHSLPVVSVDSKKAGLVPSNAPSKTDQGNQVFYLTIYLAPGDYHRFHSPTNWTVAVRRHFVGDLLSVAPYFQSRMPNLFCLNERVAMLGHWRYGMFSMTPVGATNVGSIILNCDPNLKTNQRGPHVPRMYERALNITFKPGDEMGGFRLGSTVVLMFEAPSTFKFTKEVGEYVKMGESVGDVDKH